MAQTRGRRPATPTGPRADRGDVPGVDASVRPWQTGSVVSPDAPDEQVPQVAPTGQRSTRDAATGHPNRHLAPIRWPRPDAGGVALLALWVVGIAIGIGLPALVVPPDSTSPSNGRVVGAFAVTVLGALVMAGAATAMYRRYREGGLLVFATVPTGVVLAGGFIVMGLKLFG